MDAARWERLQALFHETVDRSPAERAAFLREACPDDPDLVDEVLAAVAEDQQRDSLLDHGVERAAGQMIGVDTPERFREIGPYRLVRTIGEGGMGVVFLAERTDLGTSAAIKILRDAWLSPSRRQRFAAEQRTLARLNHAAIARLFDAGTLADGTPWIVMEFVEGVPLTDYVASGPVSLEARLRLFLQVCEAVQYAHQHLIVHRDLKPSNVLVTADGRAKLLDFGIAKDIADVRPADAGQTIARLMTPAYAAPEQARGEPAGVQADVYSLGVMLYELLTGVLPVATDARTAAGVADLDVLCLTAMHAEPARRYASVEALARDVTHFLNSEPLEARPDSLRYRTGKFVRRHWRPLAAAAAVLLAVVGLVAFYTLRLTDARNAAIAEALRTRRIQSMMLALFNGGDAAAGPADDLKVATLVDRGLLEAQGLTGEPRVQADMYDALGGIYQQLGNLPQAEKLLTDALDARRRLSGPASDDVAVSLVSLARLRVGQARFEDAERLVREALAIRRSRDAGETPALSDTSTALGEVLVEKGDYPAAIAVLEAVAASRAAEGDTPEHASTLRWLVNAYFYAGRYDDVQRVGRTVLEMTRRVHGARHPLVADDLVNLGAVEFERGRYVEAERFYREALENTEGWYGADHPRTASNLTMLGRTLVRQNRFDEAEAYLQRALGVQERVYGKVHPAVASAVNELGTVALQRDRLDEAGAAFTRMAEIYRQVFPGKHFLIGVAVSNLGSVYTARKDDVRAEALYREAIALFSETQSPAHLNVGIARLKLGRALLRQGRLSESEPELLAGMNILMKQASPSVAWVKNGREDLASLYDATKRPEKAAEYRALLAAAR
jgi:serine/threonine-protein kinase